jgi:membrane complex biogenesis BtpA family protein
MVGEDALFDGKPILGMIHLPALPTAPAHDRRMEELIAFARAEASVLESAGLDGAVVENAGDAPFFRGRVPPVTVAAMTAIVAEVKRASSMRIGVNILRNSCEEALAVAFATGADFIRCNVVIGAYVTDQGIIQGRAAELARLRAALERRVAVFGDVHVKHAHPLFDVPIEHAARDLAERGGVDAVIVSGPRSPDPPSFERLELVSDAIDLPVIVGSGLELANVVDFYERSDGVLLGEVDFKMDRRWGGASDKNAYARAVALCRHRAHDDRSAQSRGPSA